MTVFAGIAMNLFTSDRGVAITLMGAGLFFMAAGAYRFLHLNQQVPTGQELIRHTGLATAERQFMSYCLKAHVAMAVFGQILRAADFPSFNGTNPVVNTFQGTNFLAVCVLATLLGVLD